MINNKRDVYYRMIINEDFFDEIDNIEADDDIVEQKQYTHHISIICNMSFDTTLSEDAIFIFKKMFILMDNILDEYQFSVSDTSEDIGTVVSHENFGDYFNNEVTRKDYLDYFLKTSKRLNYVVHIFYDNELSFVDHVFFVNTMGVLTTKLFVTGFPAPLGILKIMNVIKIDDSQCVELWYPDSDANTSQNRIYYFISCYIEQYKKVYGKEFVSERQLRRTFNRFGLQKDNIPLFARCTFNHPTNKLPDGIYVVSVECGDNHMALHINNYPDKPHVYKLSSIMKMFEDVISTCTFDEITFGFEDSFNIETTLVVDCVVPDDIIIKLHFKHVGVLAITGACSKDFLLKLVDYSTDIIYFKNENKRLIHLYDLSDCKKEGDMVFLPQWLHIQNVVFYNTAYKSGTPDRLGYIECLEQDYSYNSKNVAYRKIYTQEQ